MSKTVGNAANCSGLLTYIDAINITRASEILKVNSKSNNIGGKGKTIMESITMTRIGAPIPLLTIFRIK
jgi:hypothetical protein